MMCNDVHATHEGVHTLFSPYTQNNPLMTPTRLHPTHKTMSPLNLEELSGHLVLDWAACSARPANPNSYWETVEVCLFP